MSNSDTVGARPAGEADDLSPQESLDLIRTQRDGAARDLRIDPVPILASWGVAWLLGFGASYFASPQARWHLLPMWAADVTIGVLSAIAATVLAVQVSRRARGLRGPSLTAGVSYGLSWPLAFAGLFGLDLGLMRHGLPAHLELLLWPGSTVVVVGTLYLGGGIAFAERVEYLLGAWMLLVGAVSVLAGAPANFAVLALAGGGAMLAAAACIRIRAGAGGRPF